MSGETIVKKELSAHERTQREKITYEEFLEGCDEDTYAEWVDGEIIMLSPASKKHQDVSGFLLKVVGIFVEQRGHGQVILAPFQMKTAAHLSGREPDLLFIAQEHLDRFKKNHLEGPADLVVEVVSPESRLRDRGEKFAEYEMGGVREYWLIDPEEQRADFYRLDDEGRYERIHSEGQIYCSGVIPGFRLKLEWLWQEPLPKVIDVLRELELM